MWYVFLKKGENILFTLIHTGDMCNPHAHVQNSWSNSFDLALIAWSCPTISTCAHNCAAWTFQWFGELVFTPLCGWCLKTGLKDVISGVISSLLQSDLWTYPKNKRYGNLKSVHLGHSCCWKISPWLIDFNLVAFAFSFWIIWKHQVYF